VKEFYAVVKKTMACPANPRCEYSHAPLLHTPAQAYRNAYVGNPMRIPTEASELTCVQRWVDDTGVAVDSLCPETCCEANPLLKEPMNATDRAEFLNMLDLVMRVGRSSHRRPWLTWGTLLGHVRDGDIIPWDNDVDVMLLEEDMEAYRDAFKEATRGTRWKITDATDYTGMVCRMVVQYKDYGGKTLDMYILRKPFDAQYLAKLGGVTRRTDVPAKRLRVFKDSDFYMEYDIDDIYPLQRDSFCGVDVYIPAKPEELLRLYYGNSWTTPMVQ
jgi:hypothetical protein